MPPHQPTPDTGNQRPLERGSGGRSRTGPGSRGGTNPPIRFNVRTNQQEVDAFHAQSQPAVVLASADDELDHILAGALESDFSKQELAPRGTAVMHPLLVERMAGWDADGRKQAVHMQQETLALDDIFPPRCWTVEQGKSGQYTEDQTIIGPLHLVRVQNAPGATMPSVEILPWVDDDDNFK